MTAAVDQAVNPRATLADIIRNEGFGALFKAPRLLLFVNFIPYNKNSLLVQTCCLVHVLSSLSNGVGPATVSACLEELST